MGLIRFGLIIENGATLLILAVIRVGASVPGIG